MKTVINSLAWLLVAACLADAADLGVVRLRCEYRTDPLGVGAEAPRLSWLLESDARGVKQTAYQVMVASTLEKLAAGEADRWDSGRVASDATTGVPFAGAAIPAGGDAYWKVRVWDGDGEPSAWSEPARWSQGLDAMAGEWIGYDATRDRTQPKLDLAGCQWIMHAGVDAMNLPKGGRLFVTTVDIPEGAAVTQGTVHALGDDVYQMSVNRATVVHRHPGFTEARPVDIGGLLEPGSNEVRFMVVNGERGPSALVARIDVELANGETITVRSGEDWHAVHPHGPDSLGRAIAPSAWTPVAAVAPYGDKPWGVAKQKNLFLPPAPLLRTEFAVDKPVADAKLYVTALGTTDAYLNGARVSEERLTPGWTEYKKRVYYRTYDVTAAIKQGANALGAELTDGWYSGHIGWGQIRDHYAREPRLRMQLELTYADGSTQTVATGPDWKAIDGPTREADMLMGEKYDATMVKTGWDSAGFDDSAWGPVDVGLPADAPTSVAIEPNPGPPIIDIEEFKPIEVSEPRPGAYVFDLGQNFAGVARLKVSGERGQVIRLRFAERLNPDGTLYTVNLRGARTIDTYVCSGEGVETWTPRHTFHGFQYVEVTGLTEPATEETITGVAISSDTPRVGSFACSDPSLNQLVSNIYWTQRMNFIDIPTDCPQRDERLGWTGDAQVYIGAAALNADVQAFFDKWLIDLEDAQRADGQFPRVAPTVVTEPDGGPAWADAGNICPWTIYEVYGDEPLLRRQYPSMKRFVEFVRGRSKDGVLPPKAYHCFGDWLSIGADTPKDVIYTAYHANSTRLLAKAADVLGYAEDAKKYHALADRIAEAFRKEYVAEDGTIRGDTQCVYVLALSNDLLTEEQAAIAADKLVADIEERGDLLSTGFIGTKDLMLVLAKIGRNDVAYRLIHQDAFPSWGFSITHGATSIWERWDGWTPDNGFQNPGMNSFAHYSFGAVYQWMVENIAGIKNGGGAYKKVVIRPTIGGELTHAATSYDGPRGLIASEWKRGADGVQVEVTVPPNTTADVYLPTAQVSAITEGGGPVGQADGVLGVEADGAATKISVGAGTYAFAIAAE